MLMSRNKVGEVVTTRTPWRAGDCAKNVPSGRRRRRSPLVSSRAIGLRSAQPCARCLRHPDPRADRDGFEEFWTLYPRKFKRAEAKAAWAKLGPDEQAAAITGAKAYAVHCREAGRDAQYIKQPANWLAEECWLEDPSAGFTTRAAKPERAPKLGKAKAANDNGPANIRGGITNMPAGDHLLEIVEYADADPWAAMAAVTITLRLLSGGEPYVHEAYLSHPLEEEWEAGRKSCRSLLYAIGGDPDVESILTQSAGTSGSALGRLSNIGPPWPPRPPNAPPHERSGAE